MGVTRSITMEVLSRDKSIIDCVDLLFKNGWTPFGRDNHISVSDGDNIIDLDNIENLYTFVSEREKATAFCQINIWDISNQESILMLISPKEEKDIFKAFKITFIPGTGKRLQGSIRYTDFSYYLERIIPLLEKNNFIFEEISCRDLG
ncbi:MAG TPA: hypothetical protein PK989_07405 [Anaerolineales bacterium]|nr:hypothetical protein [Anaerolineales bacterium]